MSHHFIDDAAQLAILKKVRLLISCLLIIAIITTAAFAWQLYLTL